ncbi:hypothetical protein WJX77_008499 [Trebouxia sp. C0004]
MIGVTIFHCAGWQTPEKVAAPCVGALPDECFLRKLSKAISKQARHAHASSPSQLQLTPTILLPTLASSQPTRSITMVWRVDTYLQGDRPAAVLFSKHQSVNTYKDFVQAEVARGLHKGVIARWPFKQPPTVNGLRVVDDKLPKLRLCINPMYVNFFMRYMPLHYEKQTDLVDLLAPED